MLRVLSANLWNGRADPAALVELVTAMRADIVVVQEAAVAQAEVLGALLLLAERGAGGLDLVSDASGVLE